LTFGVLSDTLAELSGSVEGQQASDVERRLARRLGGGGRKEDTIIIDYIRKS